MQKIFKKGDYILKENTTGNEAYIINSGRVEVFRIVRGKKVLLATLGPNQIFGEMSMIDDRPRSANVVALEDTTVTVIASQMFNKLFYSKPEDLRVFLKNIFERLRNIDQAVIDLTVGMTAEGSCGKEVILSGITPRAIKALKEEDLKINKFPFRIGRKTDNFYQDLFSNNDLYLDDIVPYNVSRNHLSIQYFKNKYLVIDRGSTLGTIVNDTKIGGRVKKHEIELARRRDNVVILGSRESPFQFQIKVP